MHDRTANTATAAQAIARALQELDQRDAKPGSAEALRAGHKAVAEIDQALRSLYDARAALVSELVAEQNRMI